MGLGERSGYSYLVFSETGRTVEQRLQVGQFLIMNKALRQDD